jgi:DNA-binding transcriptional ArsR family regulator
MLTPAEHQKLQRYIDGIDVERMANAFDALGEPNRCLIFRALLKERQVNVGQLASAVGISNSLASQHLKVLLEAGLIRRQKNGKNVYYSVYNGDALVGAIRRAVEA